MSRTGSTFTAVALLMSGGLVGSLSGCSRDFEPETAPPETMAGVEVIVAQKTIVPDWLEAVGTVQSAQSSEIASQVMGNVLEIHVREGDHVESGQMLASIDDSRLRAAVEQAMAAVTAAQNEVAVSDSDFALSEATLDRYQQLYQKKSVSPQEFDEVKARYQSAEARRATAQAGQAQAAAALDQAKTSLGYTQIRAPFAGIVAKKMVDPGTLASPGTPLFTIEDTHSYRLEATVDENSIRLVRLGAAAQVIISALGNKALSGKVGEIVPAADPSTHSVLVKINLPSDPRLRSGMFGRARLSQGKRFALLIPQAAVVKRGQLEAVYVIDRNQIAGLRYVTLGGAIGEKIEVLSGMEDGDKVVAAPGERELGGKRILSQ